MKQKLKVLLDYDDVLVDCAGHSLERLNRELGTSYTIYDIKRWGLLNSDLDKRFEYFMDPEFIAGIPVLPGAREFVDELLKVAEVFVTTSVRHECAAVRFADVVKKFPGIPPSNILIGGRKDIVRGDFMLDDGHHNIESSRVAYPVLFQKPWNFANTGTLSVNGYDEFLQLFNIVCSSMQKDISGVNAVSLIGATGSGKKKLADSLVATGMFEKVKTYSTKNDEGYNVLSFPEFTRFKEQGFFSETSIYMGEFYGMRKEDIDNIITKGKIPLMILDINGAMSAQLFCNALNVFVKSSKADCITSILKRDIPMEEKVQRIVSLDSELCNEELCDITVTSGEPDKIMEVFSKNA